MRDNWSLKDKKIRIRTSPLDTDNSKILDEYTNLYWCLGGLYESKDIEILRKKLIEDFKKYDKESHWLYGEFSEGAEKIINKRFGVEE